MRLPVIPIVVLVVLSGGAVALFLLSDVPELRLGPTLVSPLLDVEGTETEVAIAADGQRYALIASGDLWFVDLGTESQIRLTETTEAESAPAWTEGDEIITFTRGDATMAINPQDRSESLFLADARHLTWSADQVAFVRDRALWVAAPDGTDARELVPADARPHVTIRLPRYSPSGRQIVFIKTLLNLYGEVWRFELDTGALVSVIADRRAENPSSVEWMRDDAHLVYLTNRSGGLTVWYIDLDESTLIPLTEPLMGRALAAPLGIDVNGDRIVLPRHIADSDIVTSAGERLVDGPQMEMEPVVSDDGRRIAYTVENQGVFELWVLDRDTGETRFVALGRSARFSPDGNEIVYAATGLDGNRDIWKADTRTGLQEPLTDDEAIDDTPDWSPDGRTIVFASNRAGTLALWSVPAAGGRRQQINEGGYAPRFSPDGAAIAYWHEGELWTARADGTAPAPFERAVSPTWPVWSETGRAFFADGALHAEGSDPVEASIWPEFDSMGDGIWLMSMLDVESTQLWSLDLTYTE